MQPRGSETWLVKQRIEERMNATEMKMLRLMYRICYDHVENNEIKKQTKVKKTSSFVRKRCSSGMVRLVRERRMKTCDRSQIYKSAVEGDEDPAAVERY